MILKPRKKKQQQTSLVGNRSAKAKQALLTQGAIFVFTRYHLTYRVSLNKNGYACLELFVYDSDYISVYDAVYRDVEALEAAEPIKLSLFSIVYTMPPSALSVPLNDIPERSDIIMHVLNYAGLAWKVETIAPYAIPKDYTPPDAVWQSWICRLTKPLDRSGNEVQWFLLVLYNGLSWHVLRPVKIHVPPMFRSVDDFLCEFSIPHWLPQEKR